MILRAATLAGGIVGAAICSQFPEFSQQYVQRLGGTVDALNEVIADFDASAAAEGLSRKTALEQMQGTDFVERRRADMERTFARHGALQRQLQRFESAGPFMRAYHGAQLDRDVARAALAAYKPALPLTLTGAIFAGFGFVMGGGIIRALLGLLRQILRLPMRAGA